MTTPAATSTTASASSLAEQVNFQRVFAGLSQNGIPLSAAEQARLEEIARDEIRKQNGGNLAGTNLGGMGVNIIEILFSFIQKIFGGGAEIPSSLSGFGTQLASAANGATNTGKQYVLNTINANIYERLRAEGGNLAQAADLVTGLNAGPTNARDMNDSLMRQMTAAQNIPQGTSSSLNPQPVLADASAGHGLPPQATRPLTQPAIGG